MPATVLKSEKLRPTLSSAGGSPATKGFMPFLGVQLGRDGQDDPLTPLPASYRMPIPNANQVFASAYIHDSVLALPLSACASIRGLPRPAYIFFRKPRFPRSRPVK